MVEHILGEGLARSMLSELSVETEGLGNGEVSFDSEHRSSGPLLFAENLSTTLVQARVDTTDATFRTLYFDCEYSSERRKNLNCDIHYSPR